MTIPTFRDVSVHQDDGYIHDFTGLGLGNCRTDIREVRVDVCSEALSDVFCFQMTGLGRVGGKETI